MKFLFYAVAILFSGLTAKAQKAEKLYYFIEPSDSLLGVKDGSGKIIIPAHYPNLSYDDMEPVPDEQAIIFMMDVQGSIRKTPATSYGDAYDRQGRFLYHPLFFDNGDDYFHEGFTRCVEKDKAGFADSKGNIVIAPQWDWASAFNYGYAYVCNGCYLDPSRDEEHPDMVFHAGADTFYINKKGEKIALQPQSSSPKDQKIDGGYLPYPFTYTAAEQRLADSFSHTEVLHKIAFMNCYPLREGAENRMQFELIKRPSSLFPFYVVQGYEQSQGFYSAREDMVFRVDARGQWFYDDTWSNKLVPYQFWLRKELSDCEDFFKKHPDAPNKFDTRLYLRKK